MSTYLIKKGGMRSGLHFELRLFPKSQTFRFKFDESCLYEPLEKPGEPLQQVNKLAGISAGFHHDNSVRIGWACIGPNPKEIMLYGYAYKDGVRSIKEMYPVKPGEWLTLEVSLPKRALWGYRLHFYFGGTVPAPHDMKIELEWL